MMARQTRSEATRRKILNTFRSNCEASSPAMENMIHGTFVVADTLGSDEVARAAEQLTPALGGFNEAVSRVCTNWVEAMAAHGRRAIVEGDLREDLDPETVAESIVGAMFGAQLLSKAMPGGAHIARLRRMWELSLPAIVTDASLPYSRELLAREALRQIQPALSLE